jgi:hypothetical protein
LQHSAYNNRLGHYQVHGITLAANTYRNELLSADMKNQEFYFLSVMATTIKVRKLRPVDDITSIPVPCEMLLADFEQVTGLAHVELAEQADSVASR